MQKKKVFSRVKEYLVKCKKMKNKSEKKKKKNRNFNQKEARYIYQNISQT